MIASAPQRTSLALARVDAWLDTMRVIAPGTSVSGYGGPVVHWWRDSTLYCGPGFDWRYEGIIHGYLALFRRTGGRGWLDKAIRAGNDLLTAQLPGGNFRNSGFELNPTTKGTPHEAAASGGLLALAAELKQQADPSWMRYLTAARQNVSDFYVAHLWDDALPGFRDDPERATFVPNKAATVVETLFRLADLTGEDEWLYHYARPTLDSIVRHQFCRPGHALDGGIVQNRAGREVVEKYLPYYVARCVPALLGGAARFGTQRYLESAVAAGAFVLRWRDPDGAFPQVVYANGRVNRYPRWIAGVGDILRMLRLLQPHQPAADLLRTQEWLLAGQLESGAFRSADGFSAQVSQRPPHGPPDVRDLLPVVGWTDKAFRYLAEYEDPLTESAAPLAAPLGMEVLCSVRGRPGVYREDELGVEITQTGSTCYRWRKGDTWATTGNVDPPNGASHHDAP